MCGTIGNYYCLAVCSSDALVTCVVLEADGWAMMAKEAGSRLRDLASAGNN